jgi:Peptidase family S41
MLYAIFRKNLLKNMNKLFLIILLFSFHLKAQNPIDLKLGGNPIEFKITNKQTFYFNLNVEKDTSYRIVVIQKGMDLVVNLKDENNTTIAKQDAPNGAWGAETIEHTAHENKKLIVEVAPLNEDTTIQKGRFSIVWSKKKWLNWTTPIVTKLTPRQMQKDLKVFRAIREKANSGFYRYRSKPQIDSIYKWANNQLKSTRNITEFYKIIVTLTDFEGSCHNNTDLPYELNAYFTKEKGYFPFFMKHIEGKMVVNVENNDIPVGAEIISINGIKDTTLMKILDKYNSTDGYNRTQKKAQSVQSCFGGKYIAEYGIQDSFLIAYRLPFTNTIFKKSFKSISLDERNKLVVHSELHDSILNNEVLPKYSFQQINTQTAMFKIKRFDMANDNNDPNYKILCNFLDSTFLILKKNKTTNVIVDIRSNPGGSGSNSEKFFSYFATKPFKENIGAYTLFNKVPLSQYFAYSTDDVEIKEHEKLEFEKALNKRHSIFKGNKYWENETENPIWYPDSNSFKGAIYVLIDENVASAASHFASYFKSQTNATFIGVETTGGYYGHNGHTPIEYVLPNSKIKTRFSVVFVNQDVIAKLSQPIGRGILPDYEVAQTLEDFIKNEDTQMKFVLKLIEGKK